MGTFTDTTTAPDQVVVAVNVGEQGPSSISEAVFHPDLTTMQLNIVGDVVSSGRQNGKKSRKPRISEFIVLNDSSCASITLLVFPERTFTAQCHYSFKKCSQCTCILHFKVKPGELPSVP